MSINKLSILIVLLNSLLLIQCFTATPVAGGDDVNSANYLISNSEFDPSQHKLHTIKVFNEIATPFSPSETQIFFLVANELHWINDATNTLVKLGRLVDFHDNNKLLNFVEIKASRWMNQIIFVADVELSYYVYVISIPSKDDQEPSTPLISPIQNLIKHGKAQSISFFHFEQDLFCLLGSNAIAEHRSELRFLQWSRSYFQVIETIMNRNHAIDMVLVSARHNLVLIVDNKEDAEDDTMIQVHRYQSLDKVENDVHERELITERIQDIFVPYKLTAANMFFYSDTGSLRLYLSTCNGPALSAVPNSLCEYYTWKRDGIAESTRFQRLTRFPLSEAIASAAEHLQSVSNDSSILNMDSLLAIPNGDLVYTFHGLADSRTLTVSVTNLMDTLLEKRLMPDGKSIAHNLIAIYRVPNASNETIELMVQTVKIFEAKVPDATLSTANVLTPGDGPRNGDDIAAQMSRIKELLTDLRSHLISENEQFLRPMRSKIVAMKEALQMRQALQNGTIGPEPISIFCSQVKMSASPNETTVDAILLNADQNHMDASIAETYQRLKKINATRGKRSNGVEETMHVRRLTILSENHPFKGVLLKNSPNNVYQLNGKIKTHTLHVNRVSGTEPTASPIDSIVGDPGNVHSKIEVKSINGADWDSFVSSLYRKGRNTPINGNIVLTRPTSIRRLFTEQLNDVSPDDYLTIGTDQKIDSNVFISAIHVNQIESSVINNMQRFAEYVALIGRDNIVETRVRIFVCNISNSLTLSDKEGEEMTQHIVGTRMEDLSQIYNGRIVIKGSLSLQNVQLLSNADDQSSPFAPIVSDPNIVQPNAQIIVGGIPFDLQDIPRHYWMKSLDQNFADVTFMQPIIAPQLNADFLLSHPTDEYFVLSARNESPNDSLQLNLLFAGETYVSGHLYSADPSKTTLQYLSRNAVRRGSRVTLSRPIAFSGYLIVDDIGMLFDTDQFVRRNRPASDTDTLFDRTVRKVFNSTVYIANDLTVVSDQPADITIVNFNEHQSLRFDTMILIDRPQSVMGTLIFDGNLFANNFTISVFIDNAGNTSPYDVNFDVNSLLGEIFNLRENRIEYLLLNGNVQFPQGDQLSIGTFNGMLLTDYLGLVVQPQTNETTQIFGTKTFASNVSMQIISVSSFNRQIYVDDWMGKSLRLQKARDATQVIDGSGWVIGKLIAENLEVRGLINGMRLPISGHPAEFSDVIIIDGLDRNQPIKIWSNLLFTQGMQISRYADLSSTQITNCDVSQLFGSDTIDLTHSKWSSVTTLKAVQIPSSASANPTKSVSEFFRDAVVSGADQVIGGSGRNITIKANRKIIFNRIGTIPSVKSQQPLINGVNLIDLYADAVTKAIVSVDGETQPILIEGQKEFLNQYVDLNGPETICAENLNARNMDGVDVLALNETLIRRANDNLVIADGHKLVFLKPTTIDRLTIDAQSTINGVGIDDIFFIYDKTDRPLRIIFAPRDNYGPSSMCVHVLDNFELDTVNELSLKYFLENRVRKYAENGVATADISSDMQLVSGQLTFDNLIVSGSQTKIDMINDILCDDVVVTTADNSGEQHINGFKEIVGDLHINQPFHTWTVNGIELLGSYAKTVFLNQNQTLEQLSIHEPYRLGAAVLNVRNKINGITLPNEIEYSVISARSDRPDEDDEHVVGAAIKSKVKLLNYIDITNDFSIIFKKNDMFDANNNSALRRNWLTVDSFYTEMLRAANGVDEKESICPLQYHIQLEERRKKWLTVRKGQIGKRLLTLTLNANYVVHIRTSFPPSINYYNKCNFKLHKHSIFPLSSTISVNYRQRFSFDNQYIESANIFEMPQTEDVYVIVHLFNSSVVVLSNSKAYSQMQIVQTIPLVTDSSAPMIFNVKLIEWQKQRVLIIAKSMQSNSGRAKAGAAYLQFYRFDEKNRKFEPTTRIDGDFNIISSIQIGQQPGIPRANVSMGNSELYLILAKQGGRAVQFWKADGRMTRNVKFVSKREQKLNGAIESLSIFAEHDITYLSIILNDGQFHIYQYRLQARSQEWFSSVKIDASANNWQKTMVGHFGGGKAMVPFTVSGKLYLFVFMEENIGRKGGKNVAQYKLNDIAKVYTLYYF